VLRLRDKGLPGSAERKRGLYLQVKIQVPDKLSREERELYEQLRALAGKSNGISGSRRRATRWLGVAVRKDRQ